MLSTLPANINFPVLLCLHRLKHVRHGFVEALNIKSSIKVAEPYDKEAILPGKIYLAPSNYHVLCNANKSFALSTEEVIKFSRPSIDLCLDSFSLIYKEGLTAIILSGANSDGMDGASNAVKRGSRIIVQDIKDAGIRTMPESVIHSGIECKIMNNEALMKLVKTF